MRMWIVQQVLKNWSHIAFRYHAATKRQPKISLVLLPLIWNLFMICYTYPVTYCVTFCVKHIYKRKYECTLLSCWERNKIYRIFKNSLPTTRTLWSSINTFFSLDLSNGSNWKLLYDCIQHFLNCFFSFSFSDLDMLSSWFWWILGCYLPTNQKYKMIFCFLEPFSTFKRFCRECVEFG